MPNDSPALIPRFAVGDIILWGRLVKMWATGKAYHGVPVMPVPRTLAELKDQCDRVNLQVTIPSHVTGLVVASYSPETLFLRIPPKSSIENSEQYLQDPRTEYPHLPAYELYEEFEDEHGKIKKEHMLDFHAARVGDYSLAFCN